MKQCSIKFINTPTRYPIKNILLIDNNYKQQKISKQYIEQMEYKFNRICCIENKKPFLKLFLYNNFDLIILNIDNSFYNIFSYKNFNLIDICYKCNKKIILTTKHNLDNILYKKYGKHIENLRGLEVVKIPYKYTTFTEAIKRISKSRKPYNNELFIKLCNEIII